MSTTTRYVTIYLTAGCALSAHIPLDCDKLRQTQRKTDRYATLGLQLGPTNDSRAQAYAATGGDDSRGRAGCPLRRRQRCRCRPGSARVLTVHGGKLAQDLTRATLLRGRLCIRRLRIDIFHSWRVHESDDLWIELKTKSIRAAQPLEGMLAPPVEPVPCRRLTSLPPWRSCIQAHRE